MKNFLDNLTKATSINLARTTTRRKAVAKMAGSIITGIIGLTFFSDKAFAASCDMCERWGVGSWCGCGPPNGDYCPGCPSTVGGNPSGYKKSYAWGYSSTGCWCSSCSGSRNYYICCDYTKTANSSTRQYSSDCGCKWTLTQSGYCVQ